MFDCPEKKAVRPEVRVRWQGYLFATAGSGQGTGWCARSLGSWGGYASAGCCATNRISLPGAFIFEKTKNGSTKSFCDNLALWVLGHFESDHESEQIESERFAFVYRTCWTALYVAGSAPTANWTCYRAVGGQPRCTKAECSISMVATDDI